MQQIELLYDYHTNHFVDCKYCITLSSMGQGEIVFNTGRLTDYTIFVVNAGAIPLSGMLKFYPEQDVCYCDQYTVQKIDAMQTQVFIGHFVSKYTGIWLEGYAYQSAYVYLQGHI